MVSVPIFDVKGNRVGARVPMVVGNQYKVFFPSKIMAGMRGAVDYRRHLHEQKVELLEIDSWDCRVLTLEKVSSLFPHRALYVGCKH